MRQLFVPALLLLSVWDLSEAQTDYCTHCPDHTMCKYPTDEPSPVCNEVVNAEEVSQEDRDIIVNGHNYIRRLVASGNETAGKSGPLPPAGDMQIMEWDDELAQIARRWALQCTPSTDSCRQVDRFNVGQNIYYFHCDDCRNWRPDWISAIKSWYDTAKYLSKYDIAPYHYSISCGPYTQMVWSRTNRIGCAVISYAPPPDPKDPERDTIYWLHICNYGPAGNVVGPQTRLYGVATPCMWCQPFCEQEVLCRFPNN